MSIVLVTGASWSIGKATARALRERGHTVYVATPGSIATEFGDVIAQPMPARSGRRSYGELAQRIAEANVSMSQPEVAADRPKTRYEKKSAA